MNSKTPSSPHVTPSQTDIEGRSHETQGGSDTVTTEDSKHWAPVLDQICGDASRHLEEHLVSKGDVSSALLNYSDLGSHYIDLSLASESLRMDLEALGDLLIRMRSCAIHTIKPNAYVCLFLIVIVILITKLTPLHTEECKSSILCSMLATFLWSFPGAAASGVLFHLHIWYLINNCRAKTDTLLQKLAEGSLKLSDKSKLKGRFSWRVIGSLQRDDIGQDSQKDSQEDVSSGPMHEMP